MSTTSASPTARQLWNRARGLLAGAAVLALAGVILAAVRSGEDHGLLDPRSPDRHGSRAVAELLAERGVDIRVVTTSAEAARAAGPGTTVLVTRPDALSDRRRARLGSLQERGGRTVLLAPGPASLPALARGTRLGGAPVEAQPTPPDCPFPTAERAGDVHLGGLRYRTSVPDADACYLRQGLPTLVRVPAAEGDGDTVLLGAPDPLYNHRLDELGNASLALQLLGSRPHLVWYLPSLSDTAAGGGDRGFFDLAPDGWTWATAQLAVAAVLAALWRARRLGPLVTEDLPVAVPASEATEGRARLYRRADARDRAAETLRAAARARAASLTGVPPGQADHPGVLLPAVTGLLDRQPPAPAPAESPGQRPLPEPHSLLFGPAPPDDETLVGLAHDLDRLERRLAPAPGTGRSSSPYAPPTDKDRTS
ncbi:DUF4350 domain-containing protein [Streptomyces sp. JJ36]|uniref:DUF4350 domain-containing protein n=1 Tax=Streptomyces sp. JJ36 TaxID=2736645 RepID=UPI001F3B92E4|nr:DUF4350 domain-containing protein [Streptomyces sp. JJ36]MCF6526386.1 DUF4350 domain-containing protein [Streptomyces sp. JJ36]